MSYLYAFTATVMMSFVGTLVKSASGMVPASAVSFSRFFFGVLFLLLIALLGRKKPKLILWNPWIYLAACGKSLNYLCENTALRSGASYGNIVVYPVQAVALCIFSVVIFKEKLGPRKILATVLCIVGVMTVSLNGAGLSALFDGSMLPTLLFFFAGIGAAVFVLCQKKLARSLDPLNMNLSVFLLGSVITSAPIGFQTGEFHDFAVRPLLALMGLGVITGGAFLLMAKSLKNMSLLVNGMIQNTAILFTLLWGVILWKEALSVHTVTGCLIFLAGLVLINLKPKQGPFVN